MFHYKLYLSIQVKQIGIEIHFYHNTSLKDFRNAVRVLKTMEANGMVRFTSRVNILTDVPMEVLGRNDYYAYEIAWYNNKYYV